MKVCSINPRGNMGEICTPDEQALDEFATRKTWPVPSGHRRAGGRPCEFGPRTGCGRTRMFTVLVLCGYFFLISPKMCLMGMRPATSCHALRLALPLHPGLPPAPPGQWGSLVSVPFFAGTPFSSVKLSVCGTFRRLTNQMHSSSCKQGASQGKVSSSLGFWS